ncbi:MAG: flagellar hook protein FlgE [Deltaproteobacteria bacterium]|nr:flagellar hook protein FlgE [Deltaproteobacteria bacterium]
MSIIESLFSAANGITAHGDALSVVGDNISNVNTVGYKASSARFADVLGSAMSGLGASVDGVRQSHRQGGLLGTGIGTDLAIQGDGLFIVSGERETFYTRAGQFQVAADGRLLSPDGLEVQGYLAQSRGAMSSSLTSLRFPPQTSLPPSATTKIQLSGNFDAASEVPSPFDPADAGGTSNYASSTTVYDSLGVAHHVDVYYRAVGGGAYEWHALVDGGEVSGGTEGVPFEAASGTLTFTTDGKLDSESTVASSFDFNGATPAQAIEFDFGDSISTDGGAGTGTTALGGPSELRSTQDGRTSGLLEGVEIDEKGRVLGIFSNGERPVLGQVAIARFNSPESLERAGSGLFRRTMGSGEPAVGAADTGGRGSLVVGALEGSNVDLAQEFVRMIAYERGFQASSRVARTADDMLSELVNLKR